MDIKFSTVLAQVILSLFFVSFSFGQSIPQKQEQKTFNNQIILKLKPTHKCNINTNKTSLGLQSIDEIAAKQGTYTIRQMGLSTPKTAKKNRPNFENIVVLKYDNNIDIKQAIKDFEASDMIEYAESNSYGYGAGKFIPLSKTTLSGLALTPNDGAVYDFQYWSENDGTFDLNSFGVSTPPCVVDADIDLEAAWETTTGSSDVIMAILDTGCKMDHPDLAGRLIAGQDFVNNDNDPTDDNGHGSIVTSTAAATGNNSMGHAGVDWNCQVLVVKVLDENNSGLFTNIADGIIYAVDNGADVINTSIQCDGCTPPTVLQDAVEYADNNGVVVVSIMGNYNSSSLSYPGFYPQTIAVGATDCDDTRVDSTNTTWGSNFGNHIDLVAPGAWILGFRHDSDEYGRWKGGTSFSAPMVAGAASLLLSVNPDLTPQEIRQIIRSTADDQVGTSAEDTPGFDNFYGAGRLNVAAALASVIDDCDAEVGDTCDDGDACTINDVLDADCNCAGTIQDSDNDGICNANDDTNGDCILGGSCDDGDACTTNDVLDANCNCAGTIQDSDNDSVCDANDVCPGGDDTIDADGNGTPDACDDEDCSIGGSCDDGDACTTNDTLDADCNCAGTFQDSDNDSICDANDVCPGGDDTIDTDANGTPDDCDSEDGESGQCTVSTSCGQYNFDDCSAGISVQTQTQDSIATVDIYIGDQLAVSDTCVIDIEEECYGTPCDDGDDCTYYDMLDEYCNCVGYYEDYDDDGICDADDSCPYDPTNNCEEEQEDDYCGVEVDYGSDLRYISNVTMGNIDNDSQYQYYGYSDFTDLFTSLNAGSTANISLTTDGDIPAFVMHTWGAWIDYNQDGDFDDLDEHVLSATSTEATIQADIVIPANVVTGATRMRIIVKYGSDLPTPCEDILTGEIEDYTVELQSSGVCTVGTPCNDGDACTTNDVLDAACNCAGTFTDSDADGICDADDDCPSDPLNDCGGVPDYCEAYGSNTDYEYIDRVAFADIDNTSGDDGGYGNYTDQVATVGLGDIVPIGLAPGFSGQAYNEAWTVWIDYNHNGHYEDHEKVYFDVSAGSLSGHVTIPSDATLGLTGMRVAMKWRREAHPCQEFTYGEVEDYVVDITDTPQNYPLIDLRSEDNLVADPSVRISPNPATDFININLQNARDNGSMTIITLSGKTIMQQDIDADTNNLQVAVNQLPAGVYLIRLDLGGNTYLTERFVKLSH